MKNVVCFGEVMARFSPPDRLRFRQAMPGYMEVTFAGAEVNAAVAIAALGGEAGFVTALPNSEITDCCLAALRAARLDVSKIKLLEEGRLGIYFVETGANQRAGNVVYDREGTTFSQTAAAEYAWEEIFADAGWFHTTGISAGVSQLAAEATVQAVREARARGLTVSCDLNFRRKLWRWDRSMAPEALARVTFDRLLSSVDLVIGGLGDVALAAGVEISPDAPSDPATALRVARAMVAGHPGIQSVAITLREGSSSHHNRWGAVLYQASDDALFAAPTKDEVYVPYDIPSIVDRIGAGDAFAGSLIFALQRKELSAPVKAIQFAAAASCLAHSIQGDFNFCSLQEVEALMNGSNGSRVSR
ncbi:MAG TPA: sugar kinase [Opitutaceae bacterium]|nr:sugar kinase [Opitutaceae bacterium]